jgi:hypothetical protein
VASAGLCESCRWTKRITSSRDRVFYLCRLSALKPEFAKYPTLPVVTCAGYGPSDSNPSSSSG